MLRIGQVSDMVTTFSGRLRLTNPALDGTGCGGADQTRLAVAGVLPAELDGCFLQARPHPAGGAKPLLLDGIRLRDGVATRFRVVDTGEQPCPFGPVPRLAERGTVAGAPGIAVAAWPVPDDADPVWHTVVTTPGRDYAQHLVLDGFGDLVRARSFPLPGAPLVRALAVTARHVVVLDPPVAYRRAADLVGERGPYVWQPGRGARIGLLPRRADQAGDPIWFDVEPGYACRAVGAYDDADRVVLDVVWHSGDRPDPGSAPVVRWTLAPRSGTAVARRLTGPVRHAVADPCSGHLFTVSASAELSRHDPGTGEVLTWSFGPGRSAGQPVLVRKAGLAGSWLLLPVELVATRAQELLVVDAAEPAAGPVAVVRGLSGPRPGDRGTWVRPGSSAQVGSQRFGGRDDE